MKLQKASLVKYSSVLSQAILASYKVSYRILQCKTLHTIGENLILPAAIDIWGGGGVV
jgi:hypothetical protein